MTGRRPLNSWDRLKIVALLFMFVDHAGAYFFMHELWMRSIGRGSAPIFLFLAGYAASYRFSWELLGLACVMTLSNILMGEYFHPLNILVTILLCRGVFQWLERRGKVIERPVEWFIALAVFIVISCFFVQYGTLGLLFAIGGYMKRRPELYTPRMQRGFLIATFIAYAGTFAFFFDLTMAAFLLMLPVLYFDYRLLSRFEIRAIDVTTYPPWLVRLLALSSHYSGYIYAIHLMAISWITHLPI